MFTPPELAWPQSRSARQRKEERLLTCAAILPGVVCRCQERMGHCILVEVAKVVRPISVALPLGDVFDLTLPEIHFGRPLLRSVSDGSSPKNVR